MNTYRLHIFIPLLICMLLAGCIQPIQPVAEQSADYIAEEVTFTNGDITLGGTLTLPDKVGPHPAVILISGSGQQDRNEEIPIVPDYRPFQFIANYLTQQGIAVLRYDDRGVGQSTGDPSTGTSADFAQDAEAGLDYLMSRPEINPKQIGLLGHSEGSLIAAMIAARNPNVAFVVSMAGPAVNGYDLLLVQTERILATSGMSEDEITTALAEQRQMLDLTVAGDWEALETFMLEVGRRQIEALPTEQKEALGDVDAYLKQQISDSMVSMQGWMHYFLIYNPSDDWVQIKVPVLALFGGLDSQVDQAQNQLALEAALAKADNPDVTIKLFDEANHLFQKALTGHPNEYATLPAEFVPGFLEVIGDWILARVEVQINDTVASYRSENVLFRNGGVTMAGTLTVPATKAPHPVLFAISGSGEQDRDEYSVYPVLARHLARYGIAFLRYDDRGVGQSTGDRSTATTADFADDAEAALSYLLNRTDIDAAQIGLIGHSEGAAIVAMITARNSNVAFVITLAGQALDGYDLLVNSFAQLSDLPGITPERAAELAALETKSLDLALAEDWSALDAHLYHMMLDQLAALPAEVRAKIEDPAAVARKLTDEALVGYQSPWLQFSLRYDPTVDWEKVRVPVLAYFAELDDVVIPSQNRPLLEAALAKAGNDDVTVVELPGANHLFVAGLPLPLNPATLGELPDDLAPGLLGTLTDWVMAHIKNR